MLRIVAIAAGGAVGALLRYWVSTATYALLGRGFPYGTLFVNVIGSLCMGVCFVLFTERLLSSPEWRAAVLIGLLGAFTTFSTFSMETLSLLEGGAYVRAAANVALSVVLCLAATWVGVVVGRQV